MRSVLNRIVSDRFLNVLQVICALLCGYVSFYSITDGDIFWHLAAGREMVARGAILFTDPFSYTIPGARWIDVHWLFQIAVFLMEHIGGLRLLLLAKAVVVTGAMLLLFSAFRKNTGTLFVWLLAVTVFYLQRYLVPMRPIVATLLFIGADIACIERYRVSGKRHWLLIVGVVQLLWVNSQGLFPLGFVIAGCYACGELVDRYVAFRTVQRNTGIKIMAGRYGILATLPFALVAVSLLNPYGWRTLGFAFGLFVRLNPTAANQYSQTIVENMPLPAMVGTPYMHYVITIIVLTMVFLLSVSYNRQKIRTGHLLLAAAGMVLAWMAQRNGILFTLFALPGLLRNFGDGSLKQRRRVWNIGAVAVVALAAGSAVAATVNHTRMLLVWPHVLSPFSHPVESASLLQRKPVEGNLFNADRYGGYLLWKLYPEQKVSHDTRLTMRPGSFFREYLTIVEHPERFSPYALKWGITQVVLPVAPLELYLPLASWLYRNPRWHCVYTDGAEVLFRTDTTAGAPVDLNAIPTTNALIDRLEQRYAHSPVVREESVAWLGRWCLAAGALDGAKRVLRTGNSSNSRMLLAAAEEQSGAVERARRMLVEEVTNAPRNSEARLALAMLCLRTGQNGEAVRQIGILLKHDPFNKRARNILYTLVSPDPD